MSEINKQDDQFLINYMARDYSSFKQMMLDMIPEKLPEWTDRSESDFGVVLIELFAHMGDILSYYQDRVVNESFLSTARERKSIIEHLRLIGYEFNTASAASAELTLRVDKGKNGIVTIEKGAQFSTKSLKDAPSVIFEYIGPEPMVIDLESLTDDPDDKTKKILISDDKSIRLIPVVEGQTIKNEILAKSNGSPNQSYRLSQPGVLPESIELRVKDSVKNELWKKQDYFVYSRSNDPHYVWRVDEEDRASIYFGDGRLGLIPSADSEIQVTYRIGGGTKGNFGINQITEIKNAQALTNLSAKVTNPKQAVGGKERQSIQDAIKIAPSIFRSKQRAVTKEDIESLALSYYGIKKVKAIESNWNLVKLYVVPEGAGDLTDVLIKNLRDYFEDKRMLSTIIQIESPNYVNISISGKLKINPYYSHNEVISKIRYALQNDVLGIENVNFRSTLYLSKIYEAIENIEGVDSVYISRFLKNENKEDKIEENGKINLKENEFPVYNSEYIILLKDE